MSARRSEGQRNHRLELCAQHQLRKDWGRLDGLIRWALTLISYA